MRRFGRLRRIRMRGELGGEREELGPEGKLTPWIEVVYPRVVERKSAFIF